MQEFLKTHRCRRLLLVIIIGLSAVIALLAFGCHSFEEESMSTEEWAAMMLTEHREDVEAAVADMQSRQAQGVTKAYVHQSSDKPLSISLTYSTEYVTEPLEGNSLYRRLMKKCSSIELHENGAVSFARKGFLMGYTGFYYSPTGIQTDISGDADWYETDWLEYSYFCYEFGY